MRRVMAAGLLAAGCTAAGSAPTSTPPSGVASGDLLARYVDDAAFRRETLEASLVTRDNLYAQLRLASYDEAHWGALPEHNPEATPLGTGAEPGADARWSAVDLSGEDLRAIGEYAFYNYPMQVVTTLPKAISAEDHAGMWLHEGRTGAVWARLAGGRVWPAFTCATCHASVVDGQLVAGRNAPDLDLGRLAGNGERGPLWRKGTVDVTADGAPDPVAIADLRPVRFQENLHHAATLKNDPAALAVRIETLVITSMNQSVRPPRRLVAGLTAYLLSLGERAVPALSAGILGSRGHEVFARECGGCHRGEAAVGTPRRVDEVGTDPSIAESKERGTGLYRVPSLRFVGDRRRLLATGAIEDVADLLTPSPERRGKGHVFGLDLPDADRSALEAYLRAL